MTKKWYENNREKAIAKYKEWRENPEVIKKYRQENRFKSYRQEVVRKYGVHHDWFDEQMEIQKELCAICSVKFEFGDKRTTRM